MNEEGKQLTPKRGSIEHERLSSLINSMADGVLAIDDQQNIAVYNGATLNILDINTAITNKPISTVLNLVDKQNQIVNISRLITETKTSYSSRDFSLSYPDGSKINLYISIAPVKLGYGHDGTKGHVILLRDITHEKSLEEERNEFISVVSHELRTPITIAEGNISNAQLIAERGGDNAKIAEALRLAHEQIVFLSEMINDLSTLSRAERDKLVVDVESINVHQLVTDIATNYAEDAAKKGLQIKTDLNPKLELLNTGKLYLKEVLQNFVTNAIKYTETGTVTIGAAPAANGVQFYVRDTGIGISRNDQLKIFEKFFRSEDYRTRQSSGTGLGLYVTLKLAKLLHAEINVQSELNKGSIFIITVPNLTT
jgi:two-component system phosphate regulon sensor histidine kinase PhoR